MAKGENAGNLIHDLKPLIEQYLKKQMPTGEGEALDTPLRHLPI